MIGLLRFWYLDGEGVAWLFAGGDAGVYRASVSDDDAEFIEASEVWGDGEVHEELLFEKFLCCDLLALAVGERLLLLVLERRFAAAAHGNKKGPNEEYRESDEDDEFVRWERLILFCQMTTQHQQHLGAGGCGGGGGGNGGGVSGAHD